MRVVIAKWYVVIWLYVYMPYYSFPSPVIEFAVAMVDRLSGAFDTRRIVVPIDRNEALRELTEQFYLMLVLVHLRVERLETIKETTCV